MTEATDWQYIRDKVDRIADDVSHGRAILEETLPRHEEALRDLKTRMAAHDLKHARQDGFFAAGKVILVGVSSTVAVLVKWTFENWADIFGAAK